jgi:hypothetical protein
MAGGAVAAVVVVLLLVVAGIGGYFFYKRWKRWTHQRKLLSWAGDMATYTPLGDERSFRVRSSTSASISDLAFTTYVNQTLGFEILYPKDWSCIVPSSPEDPIAVQFVCPLSERAYKRFSVVRVVAPAALRPRPSCVRGCRVAAPASQRAP